MKSKWLRLITVLAIAHGVLNIIYILRNTEPLPWDQANHTRIALQLQHCFMGKYDFDNCLSLSNYYPIFTHVTASLLMLVFATNVGVAQFVGTLFFVSSIYGLYFLIKEISKSERTAFLGTLVYSMFPLIFYSSRYIWLEIPLLANSFWALYFSIKSNGFNNLRRTGLAFFFLGLVIMTKWYGSVYLFIPFLAVFLKGLKNSRAWLNVTLGLVISLLICYPWYSQNFKSIVEQTTYFSAAAPSQPGEIISLEAITWYSKIALLHQFGPILFTLSLIAFVYFLLKYPNLKVRLIFLLNIIFIYGIFSTIGNKDMRFTIIFIPIFSFFIAYLLENLKKWPYVVSGFLLGGWMLFSLANYTFGWPISQSWTYNVNIEPIGWLKILDYSEYPVERPKKDMYPTKQIAKDLYTIVTNDESNSVLIIVDYPSLNSTNLILELYLLGTPTNKWLNKSIVKVETTKGFENDSEASEFLSRYDYVLVTELETTSGLSWFKPGLDSLQKIVFEKEPQLVKEYKLPISDVNEWIKFTTPDDMIKIRGDICKTQECDSINLYKL